MNRRPLNFLDCARVRIGRDPRGVTLTVDSVVTTGLVPVRAFPFSNPDGWICLKDSRGDTAGVLENPQQLERESAEVLKAALAEQVFSPEVTDVHTLQYEDGFYLWNVETTCGQRLFRTRQSWSEVSVSRTPLGEILIRAEDGIRYRIRDLESKSLRMRQLLFPVV